MTAQAGVLRGVVLPELKAFFLPHWASHVAILSLLVWIVYLGHESYTLQEMLPTQYRDYNVIEALNKSGDPASVQIVDVRPLEVYEQGHIPGAINLPLEVLEIRYGGLNKYKEVIVVTADGDLAPATALVRIGFFKKVANLTGGMAAWVAAGQPLEQGPPPRLRTC